MRLTIFRLTLDFLCLQVIVLFANEFISSNVVQFVTSWNFLHTHRTAKAFDVKHHSFRATNQICRQNPLVTTGALRTVAPVWKRNNILLFTDIIYKRLSNFQDKLHENVSGLTVPFIRLPKILVTFCVRNLHQIITCRSPWHNTVCLPASNISQ
jgi:hypothetical protein